MPKPHANFDLVVLDLDVDLDEQHLHTICAMDMRTEILWFLWPMAC